MIGVHMGLGGHSLAGPCPGPPPSSLQPRMHEAGESPGLEGWQR